MQRISMAIQTVIFIFISIQATCTVWSQESVREEVLALQMAYCRAVEEKDSLFLESLFHPDMVITGGSGTRRNKTEEIRDALDPSYEVDFFRTRDTEIDIFENTAIVRGDLYWEMTHNGSPLALERRYTFVYLNLGGQWKLVAQHIGMPPRD